MTLAFDPDAWLKSQVSKSRPRPKAAIASPGMSPQPGGFWRVILFGFVVVLTVLLLIGPWFGDDDSSDPDYDPNGSDVSQVVAGAMGGYGSNLADVMNRIADRVDAGEIVSRDQYQSQAQAYTKAARERAFHVIDELDNKHLPAGEWSSDRSRIARYFRDKAAGHRGGTQ